MQEYKYIFVLMACEKEAYKERFEFVKNDTLVKLKQYDDVLPLIVVGREDCTESHIEGDLLVLPVKEDHYNLPIKMELMFKFIYNNFKFKRLFKLDDDVSLNNYENFVKCFSIADICGNRVDNSYSNYRQYFIDTNKSQYLDELDKSKVDKNVQCFLGTRWGISYYVIKKLNQNFFEKDLHLTDYFPLIEDVDVSYAISHYVKDVSYAFYKWNDKIGAERYTNKVVKNS